MLPTKHESAERLAKLTPQERKTLLEVARGETNKAIAAKLGISVETVKDYVQHTLRKLGVTNRTEAAVMAVRAGWLDQEP